MVYDNLRLYKVGITLDRSGLDLVYLTDAFWPLIVERVNQPTKYIFKVFCRSEVLEQSHY